MYEILKIAFLCDDDNIIKDIINYIRYKFSLYVDPTIIKNLNKKWDNFNHVLIITDNEDIKNLVPHKYSLHEKLMNYQIFDDNIKSKDRIKKINFNSIKDLKSFSDINLDSEEFFLFNNDETYIIERKTKVSKLQSLEGMISITDYYENIIKVNVVNGIIIGKYNKKVLNLCKKYLNFNVAFYIINIVNIMGNFYIKNIDTLDINIKKMYRYLSISICDRLNYKSNEFNSSTINKVYIKGDGDLNGNFITEIVSEIYPDVQIYNRWDNVDLVIKSGTYNLNWNDFRNKYFNHLRYHDRLTNKYNLYKNLGERNYIPKTYTSENFTGDTNLIYILKPYNSFGGRGISITKNIKSDILKNLIIQEYITNPLTYDGKKFHIRLHIICNNGKVYIDKNPYIMVSSSQYDINDERINVHVTNLVLQDKKVELLLSDVITRDQYDQFLKDVYIIFSDIFNTVDIFDTFPQHYEILGVDLLLDSDYKLWLLEINSNPTMNFTIKSLESIKKNLIVTSLLLTIHNIKPDIDNYLLLP